ncbi:MAG: efflux RND transporter permease subunit [Betaproteobacteria bacterium]|nr:MAG: efflux RND transporter permease subunit [Betaproteobacteria bacterium]
MWMTRVAIKNPVFCAMVMFALMVTGAVSYMRLPIDAMPDVQIPVGVVYVAYPGASPQAVENDLTKPIENALNPISGVKKIRSRSREGSSLVIVEFDLNIKMDVAIQDMRDKLAQIRPGFPKEAKDPYVSRANGDDDRPVVSLGVTSKTRAASDVTYLVEEVIRKRMENVTGVATVDTIGAASREVRIEIDPAKLRARRIGVDQLIAALRNDNLDVPVGIITAGNSDKSVRIDARFKSIADFENLVVARRDGVQVRVSDIAVVVDGVREQNSFARIDGSKAVILDMKKVRGSNTVEVGEGIKRAIERVKSELPKDLELTILSDQSRYVKASVKNVQRTILEGAGLTVLIVFLFLASWRSTVITALTLPISVVATFIALYAFGFTLNALTLMALSLCIGLLIDDAIVVRENIVRHLHMGKTHWQAAQEATDEIGLAVLATTLAIVAVFTPIAFMGGIIGLFFYQFGVTIVVAVLVSLFVSFTLDPMLSSVWPDPEGDRFKRAPWLGRLLRAFDASIEKMQHVYERVMRWALSHRWATGGIVLLTFAASIGLIASGLIGSEFMPREDQSEFGMRIETPVGSSLDYTLAKTQQVEAVLKAIPEVKLIYSWVGGNNGRNTGWVNVTLVPRDDRKRSQKDIENVARDAVKPIAGLTSAVGWNRPVQIALLGPDVSVLSRLSQQLAAEIAKIPGAVEVETSEKAAVPALAISLKRAEAAEFGITPATLGSITRTLVAGDAVTTWLSPQGNSVDVSVRLPKELKTNAQQLMQIPLNNPRAPDGEALALERVAVVSESANPKIIERSNLQRQINVSAGVSGKTQGEVSSEANRIMKEFELPPGYRFDVGGDNQMMADSFAYAMLALAMAVVFIYFVLGSQFHSFAQPIAIMMTLPLSLIGVLLALAVTRTTFNMFAMIAFIMLMGLVVKNGILLVDFANQVRRDKGASIVEALVEAGHIRLRPILMTTAAMVFGMLPMALALEEGSDGTMGRAIIGGVLSSTLLTLLVVPVIYAVIEEFKERRASKRLAKLAARSTASGSAHAPAE